MFFHCLFLQRRRENICLVQGSVVTDQPLSVVMDSVTAITGIYPMEVFFFIASQLSWQLQVVFDPSMFLHFSVLLLNRSKMMFTAVVDFLPPGSLVHLTTFFPFHTTFHSSRFRVSHFFNFLWVGKSEVIRKPIALSTCSCMSRTSRQLWPRNTGIYT